MPRTRALYSAEFREQTVALVCAGRGPADLAKEFELCADTVYGWIRQASRRAGADCAALMDDERGELRRFCKENKRFRLERGILPKAAAGFPQNDGMSFWSSDS